jgi:hypothetical protein
LLDKHYTRFGVACQHNSGNNLIFFLTGLMGLELIRIVIMDGRHGQAKLDRGTQISTVAGEKSVKKVEKKRKITVDFADLHGFWGEIWPARGG